MTFPVSRCCGLALLVAALSGCLPSPQSESDEQKEPHFLEGRSRVNAMDYTGAVESFEKALEANPQSSAAHFELGWLFDRKEPDPAAAIYHYEKYLALRPGADNAETVKDRILACKQEIARTVSLGPITEKQQRDLDRLIETNRTLEAQNKLLSDELARLRGSPNARSLTPTNPAPRTTSSPQPLRTVAEAPVGAEGTASTQGSRSTSTSGAGHSYQIKAGDTLSTIARKHGVKVEALLAANPHLDPRRLRPGQTLNVP